MPPPERRPGLGEVSVQASLSTNRRALPALCLAAVLAAPMAASAQTALKLDPAALAECGFATVAGIPLQKSSLKCNVKQEPGTGSNKPYYAVTLDGETAAGTWLRIYSRQHPDGWFTPITVVQFQEHAKKWSDERNGSNLSEPAFSPLWHVKLNTISTSGRGKMACVYGRFEGRRNVNDRAIEYAYVQYCEVGSHVVSDENVKRMFQSIRLAELGSWDASKVAAAPAAKPAPAAPAAPAREVKPDSAAEVACGFLKLKGIAYMQQTVKCEQSSRVHNEGGSVEIVTLSVRLDPSNAYLRFYSENDASAFGWKPVHSDQIRAGAQNFSGKFNPRNMSDVEGSAYRHVKMNITDNGEYACAYGNTVGSRKARGADEAMHHAWITYCEPGTHTVSDDALGKIHAALVFN
jgi:hypothetical protein